MGIIGCIVTTLTLSASRLGPKNSYFFSVDQKFRRLENGPNEIRNEKSLPEVHKLFGLKTALILHLVFKGDIPFFTPPPPALFKIAGFLKREVFKRDDRKLILLISFFKELGQKILKISLISSHL